MCGWMCGWMCTCVYVLLYICVCCVQQSVDSVWSSIDSLRPLHIERCDCWLDRSPPRPPPRHPPHWRFHFHFRFFSSFFFNFIVYHFTGYFFPVCNSFILSFFFFLFCFLLVPGSFFVSQAQRHTHTPMIFEVKFTLFIYVFWFVFQDHLSRLVVTMEATEKYFCKKWKRLASLCPSPPQCFTDNK